MKHKGLLICLLVFIFLGGIAVATGLVFRVQEITVDFTNTPQLIDNQNNRAVTSYEQKAADVTKGKNIIFSLNRDKITNAIQSSDPLVRVTNIEAKFPNKLEICVQERYPMYCITQGSRTAILDYELQIISSDARLVKGLIDISGQFIFDSSFASFHLGDNIGKYI